MKLVVEIVAAHGLMPKDGEGSVSSYAEVDFTNQLSRTKTIHKTLHPKWNQKLSFDVRNKESLQKQSILVSIYNERRSYPPGRNFLGRVKVSGSSVVKKGEEIIQRFALQSKLWLSPVKGDISLKLYTTTEPLSNPSSLDPSFDTNIPPNTNTISKSEVSSSIEKSPEYGETTTNRSEKQIIVSTKELKLETEPAKEEFSSSEEEEIEEGEEVEEDEVIKETVEVKSETICHVKKHETTVSQPLKAFQERVPVAVPIMPVMSYHQAPFAPTPPIQKVNANDCTLKDANPNLGNKWPEGAGSGPKKRIGEKLNNTYDLVEQMQYLYVRVVKAKDLPPSALTGSSDPYIEVRLGNYKGMTRHFERHPNPEWNQVFAFSKDCIQSTYLEVFVKDKQLLGRDEYVGKVVFDLNEVPIRVPPDSPLAPQWYKIEGRVNRGEVMLAVWIGTQADEAFGEACHADVASVQGLDAMQSTRSKVYVSPKLWYFRLTVIEAQDIVPRYSDKGRFPELFVKAQIGAQVLKTKICNARVGLNPSWNEDMFFVVAEPFEEQLVITVEDRVQPMKDELLARLALPLAAFEKRLDHRMVNSQWFNLESFSLAIGVPHQHKFASRLHLRGCLEGAYHVMDESTMYISDTRPTARQLWKPPIGVLEVGILGANGLVPVKCGSTTDAYCAAKYGQKWVRTRTVIGSLNPCWNEQYTWEVYDPCTVITIGVFDNCQVQTPNNVNGNTNRDIRIGKVRIRLSTLQTDRIYTHVYPLITLNPNSGVKKMGELKLAVRFTCLSLSSVVYQYGQPLLPKVHYINPLSVTQVEHLRFQAMNIVAARLARSEPPLRKEVVQYMLDADSHMWSMRRSKANFFRIMAVLSGLATTFRWINQVSHWKNPITTVLVHVLFIILVSCPELILPTLFLYMFIVGIWNYRLRPRDPPHMDIKLSCAETIHPDELDEEFDTFPTSKPPDLVRIRYDRLRSVASRIQTVGGDVATQGERIRALLSWRDPRATSLFMMFCLFGAIVFYVAPFRVLVLILGLYVLRHPRLRTRLPSVPGNYFKRLPSRADSML